MKKRSRRTERAVRTDTVAIAAKGSGALSPEEVQIRVDFVQRSLRHVLVGQGSLSDWESLYGCLKVVHAMCREGGIVTGDAAAFCALVAEDFEAVVLRIVHGAGAALRAEEAEAFEALVALFQQILEVAPQRQLHRAELSGYSQLTNDAVLCRLRDHLNGVDVSRPTDKV